MPVGMTSRNGTIRPFPEVIFPRTNSGLEKGDEAAVHAEADYKSEGICHL